MQNDRLLKGTVEKVKKAEARRARESKEQTARTKAAIEFLKKIDSKDAAAKIDNLERVERERHMTAQEQIMEFAKRDNPYSDSKMQQDFPCIKSIKAFDGFILIEADEAKSIQIARDAAIDILGLAAPAEKIFEYINSHCLRTTIMSVKKFKNCLNMVINMYTIAPQFYGICSGGSVLKDLIAEGVAAIKEASAYLKRQNKIIDPELYKMLTGSDFMSDDPRQLDKVLGADWKKELDSRSRADISKLLKA